MHALGTTRWRVRAHNNPATLHYGCGDESYARAALLETAKRYFEKHAPTQLSGAPWSLRAADYARHLAVIVGSAENVGVESARASVSSSAEPLTLSSSSDNSSLSTCDCVCHCNDVHCDLCYEDVRGEVPSGSVVRAAPVPPRAPLLERAEPEFQVLSISEHGAPLGRGCCARWSEDGFALDLYVTRPRERSYYVFWTEVYDDEEVLATLRVERQD